MLTAEHPIIFHDVSPDNVPLVAAEIFAERSRRCGAEAIDPWDFDRLLEVESEDHQTYLAHYEKRYNDGERVFTTYLADVVAGRSIGCWEFRFIPDKEDSFYEDKPFVTWTYTKERFRMYGMGKRRILIMNAAALLLHNLPLHSGSTFEHPSAWHIWTHLVDEGVAERYVEESLHSRGQYRYCFIDWPPQSYTVE